MDIGIQLRVVDEVGTLTSTTRSEDATLPHLGTYVSVRGFYLPNKKVQGACDEASDSLNLGASLHPLLLCLRNRHAIALL